MTSATSRVQEEDGAIHSNQGSRTPSAPTGRSGYRTAGRDDDGDMGSGVSDESMELDDAIRRA